MKTLSIVFQGPVTAEISALYHHLDITRRTFPEAEIIVSTWYLSSVADHTLAAKLAPLNVRLVLSDDPGPLIGQDASGTWHTNLNRLLCSARAGLAAASRPLAVKLRTDTWLSKRTLVSLLENHVLQDAGPSRDPEYQVFHNRVVTTTWFARDARGSLPWLFHPGDIMLAGRTEDLRLFFSAPLAEPDLFRPVSMPGLWSAWRYVPEQWFWVHAIRRATGRDVFAGNFHHTPQLVIDSEQFFLANFVPYSSRHLGLHWPKYWRCYPFRGLFSLYTHNRWQRLVHRYQGQPSLPPAGFMSRVLTLVWRTGYRLRVRLLRHPRLRALARRLFNHRR